ncbi:TetR/AcrR family transcriptional regulator [Actinomadura rupiterrae]|uniref:TetR/AcrR family transcriptional regulator n=1 Tax=Actinomadura rupiterrae TaxID=559627 RepID=UPI0020A2F5BD|nr:TetR/AcrR family transcriptional regulator [Actinomadura rupiterrae]MCP2339777.1 AcrR family transcriptional regulator [Actinomadura rupiterrae]
MRRTRQAIQQALMDLILEKGYNAVTVTDLINRADIGRSTFYAHFDGKRAVLAATMQQLSFLNAAPDPHGPLFAFSRPLFEHIHEQRRIIQALLGRRGGHEQAAHANEHLRGVIRDELLARGVTPTGALELTVTCVHGALMALLTRWADGEVTATPSELDAAFRATVLPGVQALLPVQ